MSNNLWTTTDASVEIHLLPGVRWFVPVATELVPAPNHYSRSLGPAGPVRDRSNDSSRVGRLHGPVDCPCAPNPKAGPRFFSSVLRCNLGTCRTDTGTLSPNSTAPAPRPWGRFLCAQVVANLRTLLHYLRVQGGNNNSLATKTAANISMQLDCSLGNWHVGSAGTTRAAFKACLHLKFGSTATGGSI